MKIQFDPNLEYQQEAIRAVTDLFDGQEICSSNFSVPSFDAQGLMRNETELGYGNKLHLLDEEITLDTVEEIAKLKEKYEADDLIRVVFRDNGFKNAEVKTNAIQILKQHGIDDVRSL